VQDDLGFSYRSRKSGEVEILRDGRVVTTLRNETAEVFLQDMLQAGELEQQELMARMTGNYKRGNERQARQHPRQHSRNRRG
jgi:hypothetical protein